jgi:arylsulfatase A-like enzyme
MSMLFKRLYFLFVIILLFNACQPTDETQRTSDTNSAGLDFRPNILWISTEDIGCTLAPYGDSTAYTPNINRLAREGIVYERAFTVAGVCAPSRSSMISAVHPTSLGTQHMRTRGIRVPDQIQAFPTYLRDAGYYCTNNVKEDYNYDVSSAAWDESSWKAHWRKRPPGKPFFAVFNNIVTHEHKTWFNQRNLMALDLDEVPIPAYYPQDNEEVKRGVARVYANIMDLDAHVGYLLQQLEDAQLMDSTIIVFWSDHGGPLPRQKRELFDSGTRVPLIVRYPNGWKAGTREDRLVSLMDLGPSMMSILGLEIPGYMQGQPFLGEASQDAARDYVFLHRDRMDGQYDMVRGVRDQHFKYFRNYYPERPNIQQIRYRMQVPLMQELARLHTAGELGADQQIWFNTSKPLEELYDTRKDPDEVHNLATDPQYEEKLAELRAAHLEWRSNTFDLGAIPEPEMHRLQQESGQTLYAWARQNPNLLAEIWEAAELNVPDADQDALLQAIRHPEPSVQYWGVYSLGQQEDVSGELLRKVREMLNAPYPSVNIAAARTLALHGQAGPAKRKLAALKSSEVPGVKMMVDYTLAEIEAQ